MKKKYTKKQIIESIKHWKKQLKSMNEDKSSYSYDSVRDALKAMHDTLKDLCYAVDNATDDNYNVVNEVLGWDETSQQLNAALHDVINLLGYKDIIY